MKDADQSILLAMKKRSFGAGKWNGFGGKLIPGETPAAALIREAQEEVSVELAERDLEKVAEIAFHFVDKPDWDQLCHVYIARVWKGEPVESEEMAPQWYPSTAIPYGNMWIDDEFWLPQVVAGKKISAEFWFQKENPDAAGEKLVKQEVKEVASF
ncbi:MAG: mutt: mutator mutT protein [Candidatus Taylorbacteria bacterium]|nr:mutt: mutator mutT protein [Candidatus Taylorbacteria bacterium]